MQLYCARPRCLRMHTLNLSYQNNHRILGEYVRFQSLFTHHYGMVRYTHAISFMEISIIYVFSMEGGELFNRIRLRHEKPFTEREAAHIILMIAKAVAHLHRMDMVCNSLY